MFLSTIKHVSHSLFNFPKRLIVLISDLTLTLLVAIYVLWLHTHASTAVTLFFPTISTPLVIMVISQAVSYWIFGLYRGVWRFASLPDLIRIIKACLSSSLVLFVASYYLGTNYLLPYLSLPLFCLLSICTLSGSRIAYRWFKDNLKLTTTGKKVLVIGAGTAGDSILRELKRKANKDFTPIGLIDDDPAKLGLEIRGVRVLGSTQQLADIAKTREVELILIAIPTAKSTQMRRVVSLCEQTAIPYRTLPSFNDIASGQASLNTMRQVSVEDLLCRDPIQFNHQKLYEYIGNKQILITGAGGSIGSELCRHIAECEPQCMILIEHSEYNLFQIQTELQKRFPNLTLHNYLVSITNKEMISQIMRQYKPDYVFHAAAYKHVPLLEPQIRVAIDNNIFGTQIVANAAAEHQVKTFILVSTDKAVNPTNIMGATKRCAEILCQCLNSQHATQFITVRFGNVLGSTGSVVPIFKQQIASGGPVTITHPDMERYFMTIKEAASLIIQTVTIKNPSDLYVLDMGEPVKIQYLAEQMLKLSGHRPNIDIDITYTGLRPGEKINEQLFYENESILRSENEKILSIKVPPIQATHFLQYLAQLKQAYLNHDEKLKEHLFNMMNREHIENKTIAMDYMNMPTMDMLQLPLAVEYLN